MKTLRASAIILIATMLAPLAGFAASPSAPSAPSATTTSRATRGALPPPARWVAVPPVDWSKIKLDDFADDELDLPFYLHHFHTVANAVREDGPTRGFMTIPCLLYTSPSPRDS